MNFEDVRPSVYPQVHAFPVKLQYVEKARKIMQEELERRNVSPQQVRKICLALDEAVTNAIEHGSLKTDSTIEFAFRFEPETVEISVTDFGGNVFNPDYFERLATVKDWGAGGRGILLIKNYMDEVYFVFTPFKSTRLVMRKKFC